MQRDLVGRPRCALVETGTYKSLSRKSSAKVTVETPYPETDLGTEAKAKLDKLLKHRLCSTQPEAYTVTGMDNQRIFKEYTTACAAIDSFVADGKHEQGRSCSVWRFVLLSLGLSFAFVGVAAVFAYWGGSESLLVDPISGTNFFGWPTKEVHTCYMNSSIVENATIVTSHTALDGLLVAKNLYCGLMLGLIFGFLDNFGLFFGMKRLDPLLYMFGTSVVSGAMVILGNNCAGPSDKRKKLIETHECADNLMAGLGNTFSGISAPPLRQRTCSLSTRAL